MSEDPETENYTTDFVITLIPDDNDAELITRFEMQQFCPDILITNYSMLEYTLLRPIEAKIWNDTRKWLHEKEENRLLFIIDEAHKHLQGLCRLIVFYSADWRYNSE